jgi:membrane protein
MRLRRQRPERGPQVREWSSSPSPAERQKVNASELAPRPEAPTPQPERREPRLDDPGATDLSARDWKAVLVRAGKEALNDRVTDVAATLAYYAFLAIPAALLVTLGLFTVLAGRDTVDTLVDRLEGVVPPETIALLRESLTRALENQGGGVVMIALGVVLALWTATGAMNSLMRGLNVVYDRKETRNFARQRITALAMLACLGAAFALVMGLLVLGPVISGAVGDALGLETVFSWIWWTVQWPVLVLGLLLAFAAIHYLGPNIEHARWSLLTLGSATSVAIWLAASGGFALYVNYFGSYNKTWGSLAAVIIVLTWLWLSALALLLGGEVNAEAERSRELRQGKPAEAELTAPPKAPAD